MRVSISRLWDAPLAPLSTGGEGVAPILIHSPLRSEGEGMRRSFIPPCTQGGLGGAWTTAVVSTIAKSDLGSVSDF